jgi:hypothetical protein
MFTGKPASHRPSQHEIANVREYAIENSPMATIPVQRADAPRVASSLSTPEAKAEQRF